LSCYNDSRRRRRDENHTEFCALFLPLLAYIAWVFQWFPMKAESWMIFIGIFLVIFAAMTAGFEMYYRITGRKYDGLLGQYRREKEDQ